MDNASRALTMASEVMIGILVLALGVYFVRSLSHFGNTTVFKSKEYLIVEEFNKPFTDLINKVERNFDNKNTNTENELNKPGIGDIVSVLNYARDVNLKAFDSYREKIIRNERLNPNDIYVKVTLEEGNVPSVLEDYYMQEKNYLAKYNDKMFALIEKYGVQIDMTNSSGGIDPTVKQINVQSVDTKKDDSGRIREIKIKFNK